ncbi:MAG: flavodoxin [Clostridiales bacterium]|jgi:flavodoxin short chain|nr:flavodoxin [Clostridiales bacterium]
MSETAVIYWSGTGNTEAMAKAIEAGLNAGGDKAVLIPVGKASPSDVGKYGKFAFGCPSMGSEVLEESEFEPFFSSIENKLQGKKVALFGSYGWGDGQWMRDWQDRVGADGALLFEEGLTVQDAPDADDCAGFGKRFAKF